MFGLNSELVMRDMSIPQILPGPKLVMEVESWSTVYKYELEGMMHRESSDRVRESIKRRPKDHAFQKLVFDHSSIRSFTCQTNKMVSLKSLAAVLALGVFSATAAPASIAVEAKGLTARDGFPVYVCEGTDFTGYCEELISPIGEYCRESKSTTT
jgi:hypothetical protein